MTATHAPAAFAADLPLPDGAAALTHWGLIRAQGADAAAFLHGQLTQDTAGLDLDHARLAGYCSAKGRLLASFVVLKLAPDELLLACHRSVLPATLKRLSMFVMRAKCKLSDATEAWALHGLLGPTAAATVGDLPPWGKRGAADGSGPALVRLPDAIADTGVAVLRALCLAPAPATPPDAPALPLATWLAWEVRAGVPVIEAATVEQFVPQMVNFELLGGINFQKGCYPGQEVVARSQYRGTTKRRVFLFVSPAAAQAGQEVFHDADPMQPAGLVVNAAVLPDGGALALVEVKLTALAGGTLHLGSVAGPLLHQKPLPYTVQIDHELV